MVNKYIELLTDIERREGTLKSLVDQGSSELKGLESSIKHLQSNLEKGNGFSQILISEYKETMESTKSRVLREVSKEKVLLEKSQRNLTLLLQKNPSLQIFEFYSKVTSRDSFRKSFVNLAEGFRQGIIPLDLLEKAKKDALKFKEVTFKEEKYMVKDNRVNYSDMIIFNQENKILFVKRSKDDSFEPNKYSLPGGHVEPAEDPLLAAIREVAEEVGLDLEKNKVVSVGIYEDSKILINYFCTKIDDTFVNLILEERELQQYEWIELEKIGDLDLILNLKENFENIINIPSLLLSSDPNSKEIANFYGLTEENIPGSGYPF